MQLAVPPSTSPGSPGPCPKRVADHVCLERAPSVAKHKVLTSGKDGRSSTQLRAIAVLTSRRYGRGATIAAKGAAGKCCELCQGAVPGCCWWGRLRVVHGVFLQRAVDVLGRVFTEGAAEQGVAATMN